MIQITKHPTSIQRKYCLSALNNVENAASKRSTHLVGDLGSGVFVK
jgi:hypothetical protein